MSKIESRADFLVKKIQLNKSQLDQEEDISKREILFKNQDRLVDFLLDESKKVRDTNDLDKMKYMREQIRIILNK
ncbi:hypothetical protein N8736_02700 [Gammaproteobacteria bacterium]|nr:hypothetical protein [Gammaproteobacteria bacterium]